MVDGQINYETDKLILLISVYILGTVFLILRRDFFLSFLNGWKTPPTAIPKTNYNYITISWVDYWNQMFLLHVLLKHHRFKPYHVTIWIGAINFVKCILLKIIWWLLSTSQETLMSFITYWINNYRSRWT